MMMRTVAAVVGQLSHELHHRGIRSRVRIAFGTAHMWASTAHVWLGGVAVGYQTCDQ